MEISNRIKNLPPYLFSEIDKMIAKARQKGVDVINFGIGDPDQPTPEAIVQTMQEVIKDPAVHRYPSYKGMYEFRKAAADWYKKHYKVSIDPENEVVALIGSKEGIAHLPFCILNSGDQALVPDPGYPVYNNGVLLAGGQPITFPLLEENNFLPDLDGFNPETARKAKLMYLNYPNNPTGAVADKEFFEKAAAFARKHDIIIAHDAAYSEIGLDDYQPHSFLEVKGAKDIGIEFNSLSKSFNMTGWRIGWAVGNKKLIEALGRFKTNIDSGIFSAIQYSGIKALDMGRAPVRRMNKIYTKRRDLLVNGLKNLGWTVSKNRGSFYIWLPVLEKKHSSQKFSKKLFEQTGVFFTPGSGYGKNGEGYLRIALTVNKKRIKEAIQRLKDRGFKY